MAAVSDTEDKHSPPKPGNSQPKKGILKNSASFDSEGHDRKEMKWDEMNILATYHPADKDYGHKKIDEPPTPYHRGSESESENDNSDEIEKVQPQDLAEQLSKATKRSPVQHVQSAEDSDDEGREETDEERGADISNSKRNAFEQKRKMHYNEFQAVKLARQLLEKDDDEELEDEEEAVSSRKRGKRSDKVKVKKELAAADDADDDHHQHHSPSTPPE